MTTNHWIERKPYPRTYGDHPTPAEVSFTCGGCGEVLVTAIEPDMVTVSPLELLDEHLAEVDRD